MATALFHSTSQSAVHSVRSMDARYLMNWLYETGGSPGIFGLCTVLTLLERDYRFVYLFFY